MVFLPQDAVTGENLKPNYIQFLKSILGTKVISGIFWFGHFKDGLFSNFASKLFPCLIR